MGVIGWKVLTQGQCLQCGKREHSISVGLDEHSYSRGVLKPGATLLPSSPLGKSVDHKTWQREEKGWARGIIQPIKCLPCMQLATVEFAAPYMISPAHPDQEWSLRLLWSISKCFPDQEYLLLTPTLVSSQAADLAAGQHYQPPGHHGFELSELEGEKPKHLLQLPWSPGTNVKVRSSGWSRGQCSWPAFALSDPEDYSVLIRAWWRAHSTMFCSSCVCTSIISLSSLAPPYLICTPVCSISIA